MNNLIQKVKTDKVVVDTDSKEFAEKTAASLPDKVKEIEASVKELLAEQPDLEQCTILFKWDKDEEQSSLPAALVVGRNEGVTLADMARAVMSCHKFTEFVVFKLSGDLGAELSANNK